jgi:hypothetical protein
MVFDSGCKSFYEVRKTSTAETEIRVTSAWRGSAGEAGKEGEMEGTV